MVNMAASDDGPPRYYTVRIVKPIAGEDAKINALARLERPRKFSAGTKIGAVGLAGK